MQTKPVFISNQQTNAAGAVGVWLSAECMLPDNDRNVVVYDDRGKVFAGAYYRDGDHGFWTDDHGLVITVMKWIDMPFTPDGRKLHRAFVDCEDQTKATEEYEQRERNFEQATSTQ